MTWKSSFIVVQVLFLALLSILLTLSLTQSTQKQIHQQLEQIIPSTTIMLKKKNNQMIKMDDLKQIQHPAIQYRFLQNDQVDFLGISFSKKYQTKKTLYISDYIQQPQKKIQGRKIKNAQEIILSKSTYEQLLYLSHQKNLINKDVYLFFEYQNRICFYKIKIVGIENKKTLMETVYFNEYAMSQILKELYQIEVGQTAFLQVKDKNILKEYLENHEKEVIDIMVTLYSQEEVLRDYVTSEKFTSEVKGIVELSQELGRSFADTVSYVAKKCNVSKDIAERKVNSFWN